MLPAQIPGLQEVLRGASDLGSRRQRLIAALPHHRSCADSESSDTALRVTRPRLTQPSRQSNAAAGHSLGVAPPPALADPDEAEVNAAVEGIRQHVAEGHQGVARLSVEALQLAASVGSDSVVNDIGDSPSASADMSGPLWTAARDALRFCMEQHPELRETGSEPFEPTLDTAAVDAETYAQPSMWGPISKTGMTYQELEDNAVRVLRDTAYSSAFFCANPLAARAVLVVLPQHVRPDAESSDFAAAVLRGLAWRRRGHVIAARARAMAADD